MTTLSLCMIVKNESKNLSRCLDSSRHQVDEIIVVDTGSEDDTAAIACSYNAKLEFFQWCDDFATARNYSLSFATTDWILVLDADEELVVESESLKELILASPPETLGFAITKIDIHQKDLTSLRVVCLFRNTLDIRYVGIFHEVPLVPHGKVVNLEGTHILHYGHSSEEVQRKNAKRNIPLLERIHSQEGLSLKLLYCLAGMYSSVGLTDKMKECYGEALDLLLPFLLSGIPPEDLSYVPQLMFNLGTLSLEQNDLEIASFICQKGMEWFPDLPPLVYLSGATLRAMGFPVGATAYFRQCLDLGYNQTYSRLHPFDRKYMTTYAAYDLGCIYTDLGNLPKAITAFELSLSFNLEFAPAYDRLSELRVKWPEFG